MPGARGEDQHVPCLEGNTGPEFAAQPQADAPLGDAQHLVAVRVEMRVVVDAVNPAVAPAVPAEQGHEALGRTVRRHEDAPADEDRQGGVGNDAVIGEMETLHPVRFD